MTVKKSNNLGIGIYIHVNRVNKGLEEACAYRLRTLLMRVLDKYNYRGSHSLSLALPVCEIACLMFTDLVLCLSHTLRSTGTHFKVYQHRVSTTKDTSSWLTVLSHLTLSRLSRLRQ